LSIQWSFTDAPRLHIRIDTGTNQAAQGEAEDADLTLETSWRDWLEVSTWGGDPRRAMLRRKLRPRGSLRLLWQMQRIFPRAA
jgi:putative sterol carrier protein